MRVDDITIYRSEAGRAALAAMYDQQLAAWPVETETHCVETRYGETHVLTAGCDGAPPLVLFHDWGESAATLHLHYDLEVLASRFRLLMPDTIGQPGRSASTRLATAVSYGEWATDTLRALDIDRTFVAGSAGGGTLALSLAAHAPDRVIRALVASPGAFDQPPKVSARVLAASLPMRIRPSHDSARRYLRALSADSCPLTAAQGHVARQMTLVAQHAEPFVPPKFDSTLLAHVRAPVYLLLGGNDPIARPQATASSAENLMLNAETEIVDGLAHFVTLDAPGLVESRMFQFFGALG